MNQIPNIEEVDNTGDKSRVVLRFPDGQLKGFIPEEHLHHQLQKDRQTWLREEIMRLEGMKRNLNPRGQEFQELHEQYNLALQHVQNRYQAELDQPTEDGMPHPFANPEGVYPPNK